MISSTVCPSPVGELTLACDETGLLGLWLSGQKYHGSTLGLAMTQNADAPALREAVQWLDRYFAGERPDAAALTLAPRGSAYRQEVWRALCEIPYGEVASYGQVAQTVAQRLGTQQASARAAGGAIGHNPISIIIPCHRVIGSNGSLTGYAGGLERKTWLLELEGAVIL
ncbi:MAG: methylated-DNA--[protein]-cysteine S-methyltransferase [Coriobacteriales bacterium]|jgi:methylated-DNA-[protein]-cysteine S-methyltransferase|nr:methylated-DNA--[protein]-cysteine S-methyltransferase [Coriobacteriales bacterium]